MHIQCQDRNGGGSEVFVLSEKGEGGGSCVYQVRKRGGLGNYQKKDENIPALPPPPIKNVPSLKAS